MAPSALCGGLAEERLVDVRVELPVGVDLYEALLGERVPELAVRRVDALLELRLLVLLGGVERALEVVEHGQELLDEPLVGARDQALLVARGPLAVVVEVGGDALEVVQVLVPLRLERAEPLLELGDAALDVCSALPSGAFSVAITTSWPLPRR